MQWMVRENLLGETQIYVLNECLKKKKGHDWIQGFAGSGKTVLLAHAINQSLAENPRLKVCVVVFTHALKDLVGTGIKEHLRGNVPIRTYPDFEKNPEDYDMIVVDEVQDLDPKVLEIIKRHTSRLIVAGDTDQSIYEDRIDSDGIDKCINPKKYKLQIIYRLTESLREIVKSILPGSQIESAKMNLRQNIMASLVKGKSFSEEVNWVWSNSKKFTVQGEPSAILIYKHSYIIKFIRAVCSIEGIPDFEPPRQFNRGYYRGVQYDYDSTNQYLAEKGIPLRYLGNGYGSLDESDSMPLVYLMTYHSSKGLDFKTIFLPFVNEGEDFYRNNEDIDRRLLYVACTRSRGNLFISYHTDRPHRYVQAMPQNLLHKMTAEIRKEKSNKDDTFYF